MELIVKSAQEKFLELIMNGRSERQALLELNVPYIHYVMTVLKDRDFAANIEDARKQRSNVWFGKIIEGADDIVDKDEVQSERLRFDKLKYLAAIDNPERYSEKSKETPEIKLTLNDFKVMSNEEAKKILDEDPFAVSVDTEYSPVEESPEEDSELL